MRYLTIVQINVFFATLLLVELVLSVWALSDFPPLLIMLLVLSQLAATCHAWTVIQKRSKKGEG